MIIKGGSRSGGAALGQYLVKEGANERATVLEIRGTVAKDLVGALKEMEAYGEGTKSEKPLYHAMISPEPPYRLTPEQVFQSVDRLEEELGLTGQPRAIVAHEHDGREHFHIAWSRTDLENMRAIPDSHNFRKHEIVARELEREFGHPHVQGAHAEREGVERPERSPSRAELRQEERTGIKGKEVKTEVTALFLASEGAEQFKEALEVEGYILAKGDKRDFVIVDRAGGDHSLARRIDGMKAAKLRDFMAPIDRDGLPSVEEAKVIIEDRLRGGSEFDRQCWDDALAANAIERTKADDAVRDRNGQHAVEVDREQDAAASAATEWDDALAANAIAKDERDRAEQERRLRDWWESHDQAMIEKAYGRGDDYVSQTQAALKDDERRQDALPNDELRPQRPSERSEDEDRIARLLDEGDSDRRKEVEIGETPGNTKSTDRIFDAFANTEMTEAQQQRMERMLGTEGGERAHSSERDDIEPDRQREAPGGGRTRGQ